MVRFWHIMVLTLAAWLFWGPAPAQSDGPCLRMGLIMQVETAERLRTVAERIFKRADLCLELVEIPVRRAEQMTLHGELDGEMLRTKLWADQHADEVVALPSALFTDQMVAVTLKARRLNVDIMADLKPYRVVIIGGHRWAEARLAGLGIDPVKTNSADRYMELLRVGRVDAGLMEESLLAQIGSPDDMALHPLEPLPYFIVLRREHAGLVPRLDEALRWVQANPLE